MSPTEPRSYAGRKISSARIFAALSCAALPANVQAQQSDVLEDFEDDILFLKRSDIVGVQDRAHPEYDPVPYRAGGAEFMPSIRVDVAYDSNIFAVRSARDDLVVRVRPALSASARLGVFDLTTLAEIDRRQYLGTGSQSTTDFTVGAGGLLDISRNSKVQLGTRSGRRTEDRADPDAPLNLRRPAQYDYASAFLGGSHRFNRVRLAGRLAAETRDYSDGTDGLGNAVDQDFRNRTLLTADAAAEYSVDPDMSIFANISLNNRNYTAQPTLAPSRSSAGYRVAAGGSFELGKLVRGQFDLGYFKQKFEDPSFKDIGGLAARAKLEYFATPLLTLTARAGRGVEESSTIGSGAFVATYVSITADYEFVRNVIITASTGYEKNRFTDIDRRYRIYGAKVVAEWKVAPRYAVLVQYDYRSQNASGTFPGREFARHIVTTGIKIAGL